MTFCFRAIIIVLCLFPNLFSPHFQLIYVVEAADINRILFVKETFEQIQGEKYVVAEITDLSHCIRW